MSTGGQPFDPVERTLTGEVHCAARPLPGITLTLTDRAGAQVARTSTGEDGRFRFDGLRAGTYIVIAAGRGYRPHAAAVGLDSAAGAPLRIDLEAATSVHGRVHDGHSGLPVAAAVVSAVAPGGEVIASTVSDPEGGYRVAGVDAPEFTLVVSAPGITPVATAVRLDAEEPRRRVDLPVNAHGSLNGTVTACGEPVAGLALTLRDEHGHGVATAVTDGEGRYRFDGVDAGRYTLHSADGSTRARPVAPAATTADVALPPR